GRLCIASGACGGFGRWHDSGQHDRWHPGPDRRGSGCPCRGIPGRDVDRTPLRPLVTPRRPAFGRLCRGIDRVRAVAAKRDLAGVTAWWACNSPRKKRALNRAKAKSRVTAARPRLLPARLAVPRKPQAREDCDLARATLFSRRRVLPPRPTPCA